MGTFTLILKEEKELWENSNNWTPTNCTTCMKWRNSISWNSKQTIKKEHKTYWLNHKETENLNKPMTFKIKTIKKKIPTRKSLRPDGVTGDSAKRRIAVPLKLFQKHRRGGNTSWLILWHQSPTKTLRELQINMPYDPGSKILDKLANGLQQHVKRLLHHDKVGFIHSRMQGCSTYENQSI